MGKVIDYRDLLADMENQLYEIEQFVLAYANPLTDEVVMEELLSIYLDVFELACYERLKKRIEQLRRWEQLDKERRT